MTNLLIQLVPISLIDSLSMLPFAVVVLAVFLGGPTPYRSSFGFVVGIFTSYTAAGVAITFGLGRVIERVSGAIIHWFMNPNALDYILSMIIGLTLVTVGHRFATARRARAETTDFSSGMNALQAFGLGAAATLGGLWGALPYFAAVDTILKMNVSLLETIAALVFYNVIFVSSCFLLIGVRVAMGQRATLVFAWVSEATTTWGRRLLIALMIGLGIVMLADGVGWLLGHPLIPTANAKTAG